MISMVQSATAVAANIQAQFIASGGVAPYVYAVLGYGSGGGAGGTIDASTGAYTAPTTVQTNPRFLFDTIEATDADGNTAQTRILVGTPFMLFCDIIQQQMGLPQGRVYLWDQKLMQPTDSEIYIAVSVMNPKPFGSSNYVNADGNEVQTVSMGATLDVDVISRSAAARDRKEEIILALASIYSRQQQTANSFYIARLPQHSGFQNLSEVDGAAIPYRYRISVGIMYKVTKVIPGSYFDTFTQPTIVVNS